MDRWIEINLSAFRRNLHRIAALVAPANTMLVVKDQAYGHGIAPIVEIANGAGISWYGALDLSTALRVRERVGDASRVLVWRYASKEELVIASRLGLELGVSESSELLTLAEEATPTIPSVHLKIDTGLRRGGALVEDWPGFVELAQRLSAEGSIRISGVWSHLSSVSDEEDSKALRVFENAASALGPHVIRHIAASTSAFERPDLRLDLVRIGGYAYGIGPGDGVTASSLGLEPVMALRARVSDVRTVGQMQIATLPIGMADGLLWTAMAPLPVSIRGREYAIASAHLSHVAVRVDEIVNVGDVATFFGDDDGYLLDKWSRVNQTLGEEIEVRLSDRLPRIYRGI